ncbi:hypothetical protein AB1Y20_007075 [Prymnesium parvum]|uniref:Mediator of RNA polymerase II transcription subunit 11 n=1 Tax=Prymnesium parvum TaxID=97485 RepID=A0AB34J0A3_PRYPA
MAALDRAEECLIQAGSAVASALEHIATARPLPDEAALDGFTDTFLKSLEEINQTLRREIDASAEKHRNEASAYEAREQCMLLHLRASLVSEHLRRMSQALDNEPCASNSS